MPVKQKIESRESRVEKGINDYI